MRVDPEILNPASVSCERCGKRLPNSEETPDGTVGLCACPRIAESGAVAEAPRLCHRCGDPLEVFREHEHGETYYRACECTIPPATEDAGQEAVTSQGAHRCRHCGATLVHVGTRSDGSPLAAQCPCETEASSERGQPRLSREAPLKIQRRVDAPPKSVFVLTSPELPEESGTRGSTLAGAVALVLAVALVGLWARGRGGDKVRPTPAKPIPRGDVAPALEDKARPWLPPGGVEILSDDAGAVTLVSGTDPSAVFRTFCRLPQFKSALVPGTLQATTPPDPDLLVGDAVLMDGTGTARQVILKRGGPTNRWSIGNGKSPISLGSPAAESDRNEGNVP